jgi:hypothetical protein
MYRRTDGQTDELVRLKFGHKERYNISFHSIITIPYHTKYPTNQLFISTCTASPRPSCYICPCPAKVRRLIFCWHAPASYTANESQNYPSHSHSPFRSCCFFLAAEQVLEPVDFAAQSSTELCAPSAYCTAEGSKCTEGEETCCGVTYPSLECECADFRDNSDNPLKYLCHYSDACLLPSCCEGAERQRNGNSCTKIGDPCKSNQNKKGVCCSDSTGSFCWTHAPTVSNIGLRASLSSV